MAETEIYERMETDASFDALKILANELPEPLILMGGWAVNLTVNKSYSEEHNAPYLGSRDVDLGFHIDVDASIEELKDSNFSKTLGILKAIGYWESGTSRFCRIRDKRTGKTLSEKEAGEIPFFDLFYLYIDPIVDRIHPKNDEVFKIKPIDEPLLSDAIDHGRMIEIQISGKILLVPQPDVLLAMKLSSFSNRTKDDKKIKDACDIYALIWHSGIPAKDIISSVKQDYPDLITKVMDQFSEDLINKASYHLGIEPDQFNGVISQLFK
ncbi:MAG: hypothetical protein GF411_04010 [Candidatus Lokiarchaeota archaeon]|nr:hypothetical protein [Candidatus Lokiarchaeota archaeon]